MAAHEAGNKERSRSHATEAVRLNADDLVSHYLLGRIAFGDGDRDDAIRHFRTGLLCTNLESAPAFAALAEFHLGKALEAEGYLTAALHAYEAFERRVTVLEEAPPTASQPGSKTTEPPVPQELDTLLRVNRGSAAGPISVIHERLGHFAEAAEAVGRLLCDEPRSSRSGSPRREETDVETRLRYARLLTAAGRYDDALAQCRRAADESADPGIVVGLLSDIRKWMGVPRMVVDDVGRIAGERPDDRSWLLAYVDLLRRFERSDQAERILAEYIEAHPEASDVAWRLCDDYLEAGQGMKAFELAARVVAADRREYAAALARMDKLASAERMVEAIFTGASRQAPVARYLLGTLALRAEHTQQGVELLEGVLETAPDFTPARLALAEQLLAQYRWQEVVDLLESADRSDANLEWALGEGYAGLDEDEQAAEHYAAAIRLNRADTRSMFALAQMYERTERPIRAQRQYEALLKADPLHERASEALVRLLAASRLFEDAEAQVRTLRKLAGSPNCIARCTARVQLSLPQANVEQCRQTLLEALKEGGPDADSLAFIAFLDNQRNDPASAEQMLARALEVAPDHLVARELLVALCSQQLRFDEAASELRSLLRRHPNRQRWVKNLANLLMIEQDYDGAAEVLSSFLERVELSGTTLLGFRRKLLQALQAAKRFKEQIATVQTWLGEDEANATLRNLLVSAQLAAGDEAAALALTRRWHLDDPSDAQAAATYREVLVETGHFAAAKQLVLEALETDPANEGLQLALIQALLSGDQFADALEVVESSLPHVTRPVTFLRAKLVIHLASQNYASAASLAEQMLQDDRLIRDLGHLEQAALRAELAEAFIRALLNAGRHDDAQAKLTRWIEQAATLSDRFHYLNLLSGVYQQRGLATEAAESLELAYSLNPTDPGINNDFGYTLADIGVRLAEAERMVRFAAARDPTNSAYLDSLGWVLYRRGRYDEARRWLLKAARALDALEDPVIHDHLGDACWRLGAQEEAIEHWKRAVELAEEALRDRESVLYRRVVESARGKVEAATEGRPPKVSSVGQEENAEGKERSATGEE